MYVKTCYFGNILYIKSRYVSFIITLHVTVEHSTNLYVVQTYVQSYGRDILTTVNARLVPKSQACKKHKTQNTIPHHNDHHNAWALAEIWTTASLSIMNHPIDDLCNTQVVSICLANFVGCYLGCVTTSPMREAIRTFPNKASTIDETTSACKNLFDAFYCNASSMIPKSESAPASGGLVMRHTIAPRPSTIFPFCKSSLFWRQHFSTPFWNCY